MTLLDELRSNIGLWVAIKDDHVIANAESISDIILYLRENQIFADSVLRVPPHDAAAEFLSLW